MFLLFWVGQRRYVSETADKTESMLFSVSVQVPRFLNKEKLKHILQYEYGSVFCPKQSMILFILTILGGRRVSHIQYR